jgi:hypothetical protein
MEGLDIMAAGNTSIALDSLNNLMTWGSNEFAGLGLGVDVGNRELPQKLSRQYSDY